MKYIIIALMLINLLPYTSYRKILVAVTLEPLAPIVYEIGGQCVEIEVLLPEGVEPHTFQLTKDVVEKASRADLIVHTGHMEWEKKLISILNKSSVGLEDYIRFGLNLTNIPGTDSVDLHGYWLDPINAIAIAKAIVEKLIEIDPMDSEIYNLSLKRFVDKMYMLMDSLTTLSKSYNLYGKKVLLTFPSEVYLIRPLGLKPIACIVRGPQILISGSELVKVREMLMKKEISFIVVSSVARRMKAVEYAEQLARETDTRIIYLRTFSLPNLYDYSSLIMYNVGLIIGSGKSLECDMQDLSEIYVSLIFILLIISIIELLYIYRLRKYV